MPPPVSNNPGQALAAGMNPGNVPVSTTTKAPVKELDYFGLKLSGVDDSFIKENLSQTGAVLKVPDAEYSWNSYGNAAFKGDRSAFDQARNQTINQQSNFNKGIYDDSTAMSLQRENDRYSSDFTTEASRLFHGLEGYSPSSHEVPKDDRYIMSPMGIYTQVKSDKQFADDKGIVEISDGKMIT